MPFALNLVSQLYNKINVIKIIFAPAKKTAHAVRFWDNSALLKWPQQRPALRK
jgi:hypothetical protein